MLLMVTSEHSDIATGTSLRLHGAISRASRRTAWPALVPSSRKGSGWPDGALRSTQRDILPSRTHWTRSRTTYCQAAELMRPGLLGTVGVALPAYSRSTNADRRPEMFAQDCADDLSATVHYALETTRAVAVCPSILKSPSA